MKFNEIPAYLGITATQLADMAGLSKQNLHAYLKGVKGKNSKVVSHVCAVAGLNREEIFFSDPFDHPDGDDPEKAAYWLALALEALHQAKERGADIDGVVSEIRRIGGDGLEWPEETE